jgi:hypothetical protein
MPRPKRTTDTTDAANAARQANQANAQQDMPRRNDLACAADAAAAGKMRFAVGTTDGG